MSNRYTYQTGVSFGGDIPTAEFDVELAYRVSWGGLRRLRHTPTAASLPNPTWLRTWRS